jgi:hypothetical protein
MGREYIGVEMIDRNIRENSEKIATKLNPRELAEYQEAIAPSSPEFRIGILSDPADEETYTIKLLMFWKNLLLRKPTKSQRTFRASKRIT